MEKTNVDERIIDDALGLCKEVLRLTKKSSGDDYFSIAMEKLTPSNSWVNFSLNNVILYLYPETPHFLEKEGLGKMGIDSWNETISSKTRGYYNITFSLERVKEWVAEVIAARLKENKKALFTMEVWHDDFRFSGSKLVLPKMGDCSFSGKSNGNQRALFVELVVFGKKSGVSVASIKSNFKKRGLNTPENRDIDTMIVQINERLNRNFPDAYVHLESKNSNGAKIIRLVVRIKEN